jgi:hypothetical protein
MVNLNQDGHSVKWFLVCMNAVFLTSLEVWSVVPWLYGMYAVCSLFLLVLLVGLTLVMF